MTHFLKTIEKIVDAAGLAERFESENHFHVRIPNNGYMDLVIESWPAEDAWSGRRRISVAHYYEQNGDLVPDPDVEINDQGYPFNITLAPPGGYTEVRCQDEEGAKINQKADKDVSSFLNIWAGNLISQGFVDAASDLNKSVDAI